MCSEWGTPRTRAPHLLRILATGNYVQFLSYFDMLPHKWGPLRKYIRILPDILAPISGNFFAKGLRPLFCRVRGRPYASINTLIPDKI